MRVKKSTLTFEGFGLIELLIAITVMGALIAIALPGFNRYRDQQKIAVSVADLRVLDNRLKSHKLRTETFPAAFNELLDRARRTPGDSPIFIYGLKARIMAPSRIPCGDKNLNPINSDFDRYSN